MLFSICTGQLYHIRQLRFSESGTDGVLNRQLLPESEAHEQTMFMRAMETGAVEPCVVNDVDLDADPNLKSAEKVTAMGTTANRSVNMDYTSGFGIAIGGPNKPL